MLKLVEQFITKQKIYIALKRNIFLFKEEVIFIFIILDLSSNTLKNNPLL